MRQGLTRGRPGSKTVGVKETPRWSLAVLGAFVSASLVYGASLLPWRTWTSFGVLTMATAAMHGVTALLCVAGVPWRRVVWRVQSFATFGYLAWLGYNVTRSATYLCALYGGLGAGVASVLAAFFVVAVALLVPAAIWGIAATGGIRVRRGAIAGGAVVVAFAGGIWHTAASARADTLTTTEGLAAAIARVVPDRAAGPGAMQTHAPAHCDAPPRQGTATIVAAFSSAEGPAIECVQAASRDATIDALRELLSPRARGRIAIDVAIALRELAAIDPVADLFALRPGLDGVCAGARCLMPWQLVALHAFSAVAPLEVLHEIRIGFDPAALREALGADPNAPLVRIETASFATDGAGELHALRRLRTARPQVDAASLHTAVRAAEDYIASAQLPDGRFEYALEPFTGEVSMDGFSVARQAGTTLVMCELAEDRTRAAAIASASLASLLPLARRHGDLLMLHDPVEPGDEPRFYDLGDTALAAIAFLSCRDLVGDRFDDAITGTTAFLRAMQREDGSFHPQFDLQRGEIVRGPDPLFAVGQAIFALVLEEARAPSDDLRAATERAMDYVAHDYWPGFGSDFFYMEENWHCLAARAALDHHRHDGYERFCVDYVRWKSRLVLDEHDGVDPDLVGGYGFGNVVLPWSAGSATFGEAAAAGLAIMDARGDAREPVASRLRLALQFLLHHQWKDAECFACAGPHPIAGAWSEHPGSPAIRIDFVQHAMGALGHGARVLGYTPA